MLKIKFKKSIFLIGGLLTIFLSGCNSGKNSSVSTNGVPSGTQSKNRTGTIQSSASSTQTKPVEYAYAAGSDGSAIINEYKVDLATGNLNKIGAFRTTNYNYVDCVVVSPNNKFVYATAYKKSNHYGIILIFSIETDGTLKQTNDWIADNNYPHSIAISADNKYLYAVSNDNVEQYSINQTTGALTKLSPFVVNANKGPNDIAISEDGKYAFVNNHYMVEPYPGYPETNAYGITSFTIDQQTGLLHQTHYTKFPHQIVSMTSINIYPYPGELFPAMGTAIGQYKTGASADLSPLAPEMVPLVAKPGNSLITPNGNNMFVASSQTGTVYVSTIEIELTKSQRSTVNVKAAADIDCIWSDFTVAAIIPAFPTSSNDDKRIDVSIDKNGKFLYVTAPSIGIFSYKVDAAGQLTPASLPNYAEPNTTPGKMTFATGSVVVPDPTPTPEPEPVTYSGRAAMVNPPLLNRTNVPVNTHILLRFPPNVDRNTLNPNNIHLEQIIKINENRSKDSNQLQQAGLLPIIVSIASISTAFNGGLLVLLNYQTSSGNLPLDADLILSENGARNIDGSYVSPLKVVLHTTTENIYSVIEPRNLESAPLNMKLRLKFPYYIDAQQTGKDAITVTEQNSNNTVNATTLIPGIKRANSYTTVTNVKGLKPGTAYIATGKVYLNQYQLPPVDVSVHFTTSDSDPEVVMVKPYPTTNVSFESKGPQIIWDAGQPLASAEITVTDRSGKSVSGESDFFGNMASFTFSDLGELGSSSSYLVTFKGTSRSGKNLVKSASFMTVDREKFDPLIIYEATNNGAGYDGGTFNNFHTTGMTTGQYADYLCNTDSNKPEDDDPPLQDGEQRPPRIFKAILVDEDRYPCTPYGCDVWNSKNWVLYEDTAYYKVDPISRYLSVGVTNDGAIFPIDEPLYDPIRNFLQGGSLRNLYAWTGIVFSDDGTKWYPAHPSLNCQDWASNSLNDYGRTGIPSSKSINSVFNRGPDQCNIGHSLYCAQQ